MRPTALLVVLGLATLTGCESPSQKLADLHAQEEVLAAQEYLTIEGMSYNMDLCYKHLGLTMLTADSSPRWKKFAAAHRITGVPSAMSQEDLRDCESLPAPVAHVTAR